MFGKNPLLLLTSALIFSSLPSALSFIPLIPHGTFLEATTLVTKNGASAFQCWRFTNPFTTSSGAGTVGASTFLIDNIANITYTVIPPFFEGGVHNAPHAQLVFFISGAARVTLPNDPSSSAYIVGGADGLILALDTTGTGHNTSYPSKEETRALQIPFDAGYVLDHIVFNDGPCKAASQVVTLG